MPQSAKWSIVGAVLLTVCVLGAVPLMLRAVDPVPQPEEPTQQVVVASRPDCAGDFPVDLPCLGGQRVEAAPKPTVVNVWAWWCEPCRKELPVVAEFASTHPEYRVVGVHADAQAANGAAFLDEVGVDTPSFQDEAGAFAGTLGLPGVVPITVVLRADGTVAAVLPTVFTTPDDLERAVQEALR
ncbi:TlpA disulfide reductase family protein [Corynebacterium sp.]|uniref:TlpA family protein disulfide reductase n=1 Tax=Corynebacterium sp. TaxID=1720 RepID=UPI0026DBDE17|nr:TlpA disulfide reductase family protein [Corynebacterium sp.]MDO5077765.1 TlpA disulfide reductase family protein [Corynebacterium sp.]